MRYPGFLFILIGPSGSGKSTIIDAVRHMGNLRQLPTATTRPIRPNEVHGVHHIFMQEHEFKALIAANELVEYQFIHKAGYYGTPRNTLEEALRKGDNLIADIDIYGAQALKKAFPENVILIFIAPPDEASLEARIRERHTDTDQQIQIRMERVRMEMSHALQMDYVIINENADIAGELARKIISNIIEGKRLEDETKMVVQVWLPHPQQPDKLIASENNTLPVYPIKQISSAFQEVSAQLQQQNIKIRAATDQLSQAIRLQENQGEIVLSAQVLFAPENVRWENISEMSIPFYITASLMPQVTP